MLTFPFAEETPDEDEFVAAVEDEAEAGPEDEEEEEEEALLTWDVEES